MLAAAQFETLTYLQPVCNLLCDTVGINKHKQKGTKATVVQSDQYKESMEYEIKDISNTVTLKDLSVKKATTHHKMTS